jgi:hypothetical protein
MLRWLTTIASVFSLLLCVATAALWVRSRSREDLVSRVIHGDRYTLISKESRIGLYAPPPPAKDPQVRKAAEDVVAALNNDQVWWEGMYSHPDFPPFFWITYPRPYYHTPAELAQKQLSSCGLSRPLLSALEDPKRVTVAHLLLIGKTHSRLDDVPAHPIPGKFLGK